MHVKRQLPRCLQSVSDEASTAEVLARIMVLDTDNFFRVGLEALLLTKSNHQVVSVVSCPAEIPGAIERLAPNVAIFDPDVFVDQVCREIFATIATIVCTTSMDKDELWCQEMVMLGCKGVVFKQETSPVLLSAISEVLNGRVWLNSTTAAFLARNKRFSKRSIISDRERQVLSLVVRGLTYKQIASELEIAECTVKNHIHNMFVKLKLESRQELSLWGLANGL